MFPRGLIWLVFALSFRATSPVLGQSCDCPSACEVTLNNFVNWSQESIRTGRGTMKQSRTKAYSYISGYTLYPLLLIHWTNIGDDTLRPSSWNRSTARFVVQIISYPFEIWFLSLWQCCWDVIQNSERKDYFKHQSRVIATLRDLTQRRFIGYPKKRVIFLGLCVWICCRKQNAIANTFCAGRWCSYYIFWAMLSVWVKSTCN